MAVSVLVVKLSWPFCYVGFAALNACRFLVVFVVIKPRMSWMLRDARMLLAGAVLVVLIPFWVWSFSWCCRGYSWATRMQACW